MKWSKDMIKNLTKGELLDLIDHHMNILNLYVWREKSIALSYFAGNPLRVPLESGKKIVECLEELNKVNKS